MYKNYIKRIIDLLLAVIGFLIISPVFLLLWLLLVVANKGAGAFFTQPRPGKNERTFRVIKFKTMTDERDSEGNLLPDAKSLQPIPQKHHTHLFNLLHCIKFASAKEVYVYPLTQTETK